MKNRNKMFINGEVFTLVEFLEGNMASAIVEYDKDSEKYLLCTKNTDLFGITTVYLDSGFGTMNSHNNVLGEYMVVNIPQYSDVLMMFTRETCLYNSVVLKEEKFLDILEYFEAKDTKVQDFYTYMEVLKYQYEKAFSRMASPYVNKLNGNDYNKIEKLISRSLVQNEKAYNDFIDNIKRVNPILKPEGIGRAVEFGEIKNLLLKFEFDNYELMKYCLAGILDIEELAKSEFETDFSMRSCENNAIYRNATEKIYNSPSKEMIHYRVLNDFLKEKGYKTITLKILKGGMVKVYSKMYLGNEILFYSVSGHIPYSMKEIESIHYNGRVIWDFEMLKGA